MNAFQINRSDLQDLIQAKVLEVTNEPAYNWNSPFKSFMTDEKGRPVIRVGIINFDLDTDIWAGLRSPALVGMHPVSPADIWRHYACLTSMTVRPDGSPNPLAMPEPLEDAKKRYRRGVIVCGMLAVNPEIYQLYGEKISQGDKDPFDYYSRATGDVSRIINKAIGKTGLALINPNRAVVAMTDRNIEMVIKRTKSDYYSGRYHGPCNNHWPNNSLAVMTGLLRFGVNRIAFRDEVSADGKRRRLFGRYRTIVIFDQELPVMDNGAGVTLLDPARLKELKRISDYTIVSDDVVVRRYCTYNLTGADGETLCGKCLPACPSGALQNSTPTPFGSYDDAVTNQEHRFWEGTLDFDYANCVNDRSQKGQLYEDYVCARCEVVCASEGIRKSAIELMQINKSS
jgi:ferredoxin